LAFFFFPISFWTLLISAPICVAAYWAARNQCAFQVGGHSHTFARFFEELDDLVHHFDWIAAAPLAFPDLFGIPAAGHYEVVDVQHY
jgi:hypothetical protein